MTCAVTAWLALALGASASRPAPPDAPAPPEQVQQAVAAAIEGARNAEEKATRLLDASRTAATGTLRAAFLHEAIEHGLAARSVPGCRLAERALDLLANEAAGPPGEAGARRTAVYRLWYGLPQPRPEKEAVRGKYLAALTASAGRAETARAWKQAVGIYAEARRLVPYRSDRGRNLYRRQKRAEYLREARERADGLAGGLAADPGQTEARLDLVRRLTLQLNEPAQAAKHCAADLPEAWRTYLPLAATPVADLSAAQCRELGRWYHEHLAAEAASFARANALLQARICFERSLALDERDPAVRTALDRICTQLGELANRGIWPVDPRGLTALEASRRLRLELAPGVRMEFVLLAPGKFRMGCPSSEPGRRSGDLPPREARIERPFYLGVHEATRGQFAAFVAATRYRTDAERAGWAWVRAADRAAGWQKKPGASWRACGCAQTDHHPVVCVSWKDARAFCTWLGRKVGRTVRLPTETEWEYACRAETTSPFHFGTEARKLTEHAWYVDNSGRSTHPVGRKRPSPWGLFDMHGNVWEWCDDAFSMQPASGGRARPRPPSAEEHRVIRGGSWRLGADFLRSACRACYPPDSAYSTIGFRVVVEKR